MAQFNSLRIILQYDDDDMTLRSIVAPGMKPDQVYAMLAQALFAPRSVALVGASDRPDRASHDVMRFALVTDAAEQRLPCPCGENGCLSPIRRA